MGRVVGHVLFSDLPILTDDGTVAALSLAPVVVFPEFKKRGVGSALVREGLESAGWQATASSSSSGTRTSTPGSASRGRLAESLSSLFGVQEAWMAVELVQGQGGTTGWVRYPPPFGAGVRVRPVYHPDRDKWVRTRTALWPDDSDERGDLGVFFAACSAHPRHRSRGRCWSPGGLPLAWAGSLRRRSRPVGYVEGWFVDDMRR